jgi:hypothetical protein
MSGAMLDKLIRFQRPERAPRRTVADDSAGLRRQRPDWLFRLLGTNDVQRFGSACSPRRGSPLRPCAARPPFGCRTPTDRPDQA